MPVGGSGHDGKGPAHRKPQHSHTGFRHPVIHVPDSSINVQLFTIPEGSWCAVTLTPVPAVKQQHAVSRTPDGRPYTNKVSLGAVPARTADDNASFTAIHP